MNQDGSTDSLTLEADYRIRATISNAGMSIGAVLALTIEGMKPHDINRLSFVGNYSNADRPTVVNQSSSSVIVRAGTYGQALNTVFVGNIFESYASFNGGSCTFHVKAMTITTLTRELPDAISYRGPQSVVSILSDICANAGLTLVDHGGWGSRPQLHNHYGEGTKLRQIEEVIEATGGVFDMRDSNGDDTKDGGATLGTVHVWGPDWGGVSDNTKQHSLPHITPHTGLIGYPEYSGNAIKFDCLFRADISFFDPIVVKSSQLPAGWVADDQGRNEQGQQIGSPDVPWNGTWIPLFISHDLSSEIPNGPWLTHVECQRANVGQKFVITK